MPLFFTAVTRHWKETSKWLMFTLLGGLVPVWGGMLMFRLFSIKFDFGTFSNNGEFALYSAGMLASAFYLIVKDHKSTQFIYRTFFTLICLGCLLASVIFFASVTAVNSLGKEKFPITLDADFLRHSTLLLFIISVILGFITTAIDNYRILPEDIKNERQDELNKLGDEFDKLGGEDESK